jgi:hypothetical protein
MSNRFDLVSNPARIGGLFIRIPPDPALDTQRYHVLASCEVRITMVPRSLWCAFSALEQGEQGPHSPEWGAGGPPALPGKSGAEPAP